MRFDYFSMLGYLSVVLWVAVPVLWVMHFKRRPRRWLCHIALAVGVLSYAFAKLNSLTYVNRIELDQSAEIAETQAKLEEARKAAEEARGGDVAQIRFAEDASGDFLDTAGMDEADRKYLEKVNEDAKPVWKKEKKQRGLDVREDDSLEAMIGARGETQGIEASVGDDTDGGRRVILMEGKDKAIANRLDTLNLQVIRLLLLLGVIIVIVDYLRRANIYEEAYLPLPLPGSWVNGLTQIQPVSTRPVPARRSVVDELVWITKRGDSFVYMTDDPGCAESVPTLIPRLGKRWHPVDVIRAGSGADGVTDEFIFETVWYGRSSFVIDSAERAIQALGQFMTFLSQRKECRARVNNTVHLVWDCSVPLDEAWQVEFAKLMKSVGMTLFVCGGR